MDDKIKKAIDNIDNNKEDKVKHINEDKKSDLILFEMNKEDILKMHKKEEQKNTEMDNSYRDKDKKSVIITIKRNKIIEDLKEEIKNVKTSPENNDKLKKSLDIKSVKIINNEEIKEENNEKKEENKTEETKVEEMKNLLYQTENNINRLKNIADDMNNENSKNNEILRKQNISKANVNKHIEHLMNEKKNK